jgi:excisionase family DNA binding protein
MPATTDVPRLLLSTSEVARSLGVSPRFVKSLIQAGELPSLKVGRLRRVALPDLEAWVERQRGAEGLARPGPGPMRSPGRGTRRQVADETASASGAPQLLGSLPQPPRESSDGRRGPASSMPALRRAPRTHRQGDPTHAVANPKNAGSSRARARAREGEPMVGVRTGQSESVADPMAEQVAERLAERVSEQARDEGPRA